MQRGTGNPGSLPLAGMFSLMQNSPFFEAKLSCKGAEQLMNWWLPNGSSSQARYGSNCSASKVQLQRKAIRGICVSYQKSRTWHRLDTTSSWVKWRRWTTVSLQTLAFHCCSLIIFHVLLNIFSKLIVANCLDNPGSMKQWEINNKKKWEEFFNEHK